MAQAQAFTRRTDGTGKAQIISEVLDKHLPDG
jgi:hypothetical protein